MIKVSIVGLLVVVSQFRFCEGSLSSSRFLPYRILDGTHRSIAIDKPIKINDDSLSYEVIFDESAQYLSRDHVNQYDINKLFGFSDCGDYHHESSARFGWRWSIEPVNSGVLIYAYIYENSVRKIHYLGNVELDRPYKYMLKISGDNYRFSIEEVMDGYVEFPRSNNCDAGIKYQLYPYFGGDETAPHTITIYMKRDRD